MRERSGYIGAVPKAFGILHFGSLQKNFKHMKRIWLSCLILGFLIVSCKPDSKNQNDTANDPTPQIQKIGDGNAVPPVAPEPSPLVDALTASEFWVFEFYVVPGDQSRSQANKGRWYSLKPDGTFQSGHWEELTGNGSWRIENRLGKNFIILDSTVDAEDAEWEIKLGAEGEAMSWVGTENYGRSSHMLKVISLLSRPTKKQFGVEEK